MKCLHFLKLTALSLPSMPNDSQICPRKPSRSPVQFHVLPQHPACDAARSHGNYSHLILTVSL